MTVLIGCASNSARQTAPVPASALSVQPRVETGTLQGAPYRITVPANRNGELAVNALEAVRSC